MYTLNEIPFLPTFLDKGHTQIFNPEEWDFYTYGLIAAGKDQLQMLVEKCMRKSHPHLTLRCSDPDQEFPGTFNPRTDDPGDYSEGNREKARARHIKHSLMKDTVALYQSGGATLHGPYGRGEMVMDSIQRGKKTFHIFGDTPVPVCWKRNADRGARGKRYTRSKEFWRCADTVPRNFELLSAEQRDEEGNIYNTGMVLRYVSKYKYEVNWPDGTRFFVHYHWDPKTNDPYLTPWVD